MVPDGREWGTTVKATWGGTEGSLNLDFRLPHHMNGNFLEGDIRHCACRRMSLGDACQSF